MRSRFRLWGLFVVLALCLFALPIHAQTAEAATKSTVRPWYDSSKEVTVTGTVSSVLKKTTPEMKVLGGSHLMVETHSGQVDASLGNLALRGEGALTITPGERIELIGVMKIINGKQVLFTRLVQVDGRSYIIRNEHGYALAQGSAKPSANRETNGEQQ